VIYRTLTPQLLAMLNIFPIVCLTGARQSGKTTLARSLATELPKPTLYLDAERASDMNKLREAELFLSQYRDSCVIIDEVQRVPELFPLLRSLVDEDRTTSDGQGTTGRFLLLGSAAPDLMRQASESLAGRVAYLELTPFQRGEIRQDVPVLEHWVRGGFPKSVLADEETSDIWREMFIASYLERDLAALGFSFTPALMRRLWAMLAHYHASPFNASELAQSLGVSAPTISRYVEILEGAYLLHRLMPYHANIKKRLVKTPKVYLRDSGLLHSLLQCRTFLDVSGHPLCGRSWEGFVIEQIQHALPRGLEAMYYRTQTGVELDLLLVQGQRVVAGIEIKYSSAPQLSQGTYIAAADVQAEQCFVIIPHGEPYKSSRDMTVCGLDAFLQDILPAVKKL
jgi:predicted AAA+ superfamily ATPase